MHPSCPIVERLTSSLESALQSNGLSAPYGCCTGDWEMYGIARSAAYKYRMATAAGLQALCRNTFSGVTLAHVLVVTSARRSGANHSLSMLDDFRGALIRRVNGLRVLSAAEVYLASPSTFTGVCAT